MKNMKKAYKTPDIELLWLNASDILTTSPETEPETDEEEGKWTPWV